MKVGRIQDFIEHPAEQKTLHGPACKAAYRRLGCAAAEPQQSQCNGEALEGAYLKKRSLRSRRISRTASAFTSIRCARSSAFVPSCSSCNNSADVRMTPTVLFKSCIDLRSRCSSSSFIAENLTQGLTVRNSRLIPLWSTSSRLPERFI